MTFIHLIIENFINDFIIGVITAPTALFLNAFANFQLPESLQIAKAPLIPALQSNWLIMHVTVMLLSYATLICGCLLSIAFLFLFNSKSKNLLKNVFFEKTFLRKNFHLQKVNGKKQYQQPSVITYKQKYNEKYPTLTRLELKSRVTSLTLTNNFLNYQPWKPCARRQRVYPRMINKPMVDTSAFSETSRASWGVFSKDAGNLPCCAKAASSQGERKRSWVNPTRALALPINGSTVYSQLDEKVSAGAAFKAQKLLFFEKKRELLLQKLDQLSFRAIGIGFPFLTIGILSGSVWANEAWGSYWNWDPKETWSLITWIIFAIYLHLRFTKNWNGLKSAILATVGFLSVWICFLGVNFLAKGLHSYGWFH